VYVSAWLDFCGDPDATCLLLLREAGRHTCVVSTAAEHGRGSCRATDLWSLICRTLLPGGDLFGTAVPISIMCCRWCVKVNPHLFPRAIKAIPLSVHQNSLRVNQSRSLRVCRAISRVSIKAIIPVYGGGSQADLLSSSPFLQNRSRRAQCDCCSGSREAECRWCHGTGEVPCMARIDRGGGTHPRGM